MRDGTRYREKQKTVILLSLNHALLWIAGFVRLFFVKSLFDFALYNHQLFALTLTSAWKKVHHKKVYGKITGDESENIVK